MSLHIYIERERERDYLPRVGCGGRGASRRRKGGSALTWLERQVLGAVPQIGWFPIWYFPKIRGPQYRPQYYSPHYGDVSGLKVPVWEFLDISGPQGPAGCIAMTVLKTNTRIYVCVYIYICTGSHRHTNAGSSLVSQQSRKVKVTLHPQPQVLSPTPETW